MLIHCLRASCSFVAPILLLAACGDAAENGSATPAPSGQSGAAGPAPILTTEAARDVHSYAQPAEARVTHVDLDLTADFEAQTLSGTATLDVLAQEGAEEIVLDTRGLDISGIANAAGEPLDYEIGASDPNLGAPLTVDLEGADEIVVSYSTQPGAQALQWLSPEQTAGGEHPYLFSQGQAILTRTWVPTQDSPGVRQTWEADITVPAPLTAVMSAEMLTPEGVPNENGTRTFSFRMDKPVAPYLIALAVGDLAFQSLGPRTGVWTEPEMLEASAAEFEDLERMVEVAEELYGPYRWGRYDILVLPPSFPFGGMENPRLTFATPTILAGDKSLVSLVAHELAHSWSGNLVTNATWDDFWLNEGFTVYFENRIMEALYGERTADMLADLGWDGMQDSIEAVGGPTSPDTQLHLDLEGRDPDEGMTDIAYEKGAVFLRTIEEAVGRERFDEYLRGYFDRHAFQPQTTEGFLADLREHLIQGDAALEEALQLDRWAYEPGLPENAVHVRSEAFEAVDAAAQSFGEGGEAASIPWADWSTQERVRFLNRLPRELAVPRLAALDEAFGLSEAGNSEVRFAWLQLALANRFEPAVASAEAFLTSQGRRKFVAPLFETLMAEGEWGEPIARRIYAEARPGYHSVTTGTVDETVGVPAGAE